MEHKTAALIKHDRFMSTIFEQDGTEVYPYDELMDKYISGRVHPDDDDGGDEAGKRDGRVQKSTGGDSEEK